MIKRVLTTVVAATFLAALPNLHSAEKGKAQVDPSKLPPASDKKGVTFAADIQPVFEKSCVKCHGAEKPKAKLRLDSLPGTMKGSEDGPVVKPGDSASSVLVHNIAHVGDPDMYMPPPKNKANIGPLTKEQIGLIRAWIDQGAK
jgi:hypothetical protein